MGNCTKQPKAQSVGVEIFVETVVSLTTATIIKIRYTKPNGTSVGSFTATAKTIGTAVGCSYTTTTVNDIDVPGLWSFEVYAEGPGYKLHGTTVQQEFVSVMPGVFA